MFSALDGRLQDTVVFRLLVQWTRSSSAFSIALYLCFFLKLFTRITVVLE